MTCVSKPKRITTSFDISRTEDNELSTVSVKSIKNFGSSMDLSKRTAYVHRLNTQLSTGSYCHMKSAQMHKVLRGCNVLLDWAQTNSGFNYAFDF